MNEYPSSNSAAQTTFAVADEPSTSFGPVSVAHGDASIGLAVIADPTTTPKDDCLIRAMSRVYREHNVSCVTSNTHQQQPGTCRVLPKQSLAALGPAKNHRSHGPSETASPQSAFASPTSSIRFRRHNPYALPTPNDDSLMLSRDEISVAEDAGHADLILPSSAVTPQFFAHHDADDDLHSHDGDATTPSAGYRSAAGHSLQGSHPQFGRSTASPSPQHHHQDPSSLASMASQLNRQALKGRQQEISPTAEPAPTTWSALPVTVEQLESMIKPTPFPVDVPCPRGFVMTVYNGDISRHFSVNSEDVKITRGLVKYVDHHVRYGAHMRFRFQLCHNYLHGRCCKAAECTYIHATNLPQANHEVHLNPFAPRRLAADRHGHEIPASVQDDPAVVDRYPTLPAGYVLTIHAPNDAHSTTQGPNGERVRVSPQQISSELILLTKGSELALNCLKSSNSRSGRPRHCAHYQFKRICNLGQDCSFIHSKVPFADAEAAATTASTQASVTPRHGTCHAPDEAVYPVRPYPQYEHGSWNYGAPRDDSFVAGMQYAANLLASQHQHPWASAELPAGVPAQLWSKAPQHRFAHC